MDIKLLNTWIVYTSAETSPTKPVSVLDSSSNSKETSLQQPPSTSACSSASVSVSEHDTVSTTRFSSTSRPSTGTRSSFRMCCVCGRELVTFRKYTNLTKELAQKISVLAGQDKSIDLSASARKICLSCKQKVEKAAKMATIVKHAFHWQHEAEENYKAQAVSASVSAPIAVSRVQYNNEANTGNISISSGKSSTPSVQKKRMSKTCESPVVSLERSAKIQKITAAASTQKKLNFSTGAFSSAKPPSVTASSSDKATHLQTMQQNTSVTSKSNTGVNEGTMTELTWIELPRKLVQSKDASTQWEKQPPTHSTQAASTSSTQDLDKPSCGDDGELEQDDLGWCSEDTPAMQEDEFMDSSEPSDVHIDGSTIVAGSRGDVEETTVAESRERERSNTPILRRIKEEMIDELEEGDYQTLYVKEEYLEDECQDDDYASVHLTSGGHPRLEAESPRSTQQTNSYRAPRQNGGPSIGSKKMYRLKFHVTQGNTKVECAINSPSETVKGENLKEAICDKLQVSLDEDLLQYFDESWQDWVDIAPLMALRGGLKLRVIQTSLRAELSHQIPTTNSENNHRLKYLVALVNNKQVLTVDSPESTVSGAAVKEAVCGMLHDLADDLLLQYFDEGWQDWINVETSMMLGGRMRLKIIQTNLRAELSHQTPTSNSQNNHRLKYLVALGNNKQVLTVDSPKSTVSGAAIKEAVCGMLRDLADGLLLQYFDEGWQDWIDVETSMMLRGRMRLNVIQASHKSLSDLRC